jgi:hypothetical protein
MTDDWRRRRDFQKRSKNRNAGFWLHETSSSSFLSTNEKWELYKRCTDHFIQASISSLLKIDYRSLILHKQLKCSLSSIKTSSDEQFKKDQIGRENAGSAWCKGRSRYRRSFTLIYKFLVGHNVLHALPTVHYVKSPLHATIFSFAII